VEAIRALATDVDPGPQAPAMAALLDETSSTATPTDASFGRFLMSRAVTRYLSAVARSRPLAVVLDDLHRGDSETLALLEAVATGGAGVPMLLIAAYRPAEVTPGLRDNLAALAALQPARIGLGGLDPAHAARLIRSIAGVQPDAATLTALVERTGGNPFYLTESARLLGSEGGLVATSKVPEGVRDVLRRRFARLPELTVSVLRLASRDDRRDPAGTDRGGHRVSGTAAVRRADRWGGDGCIRRRTRRYGARRPGPAARPGCRCQGALRGGAGLSRQCGNDYWAEQAGTRLASV
jgi:hypothetical protein